MEDVIMELELVQPQYEELIYFLGEISTTNLKAICSLLDIKYNSDLHTALMNSYYLLSKQYEEKFML